MVAMILILSLSIINPQLTIIHFCLPLKKTNHILVDVKLKELIDLTIYKGKLDGLL